MKTASILTGLLIGTAVSVVAGQILVQDDFAAGNTTGWTKNGTTTTLTVMDDTSGLGSGNAMKYATTGKNNMWAERSLGQTVTLDVNDSISLAMDIRFTGDRNSPPAVNNSIRWMFMTTADVMTGAGINAGAAQPQGSWFVVGTTMQQSKFASTSLGTTSHNVLLTLTRKDDGAGSYMQYSYSIDGGTAFVKNGNVIASPTTEFSFDAIQLGSTAIDDLSGTQGFDGVLYDNVTVTLTDSDPAYTLAVTGGTGGGSYTNGQQVTVTASNVTGKTFFQWTGDTQYAASVTSSPTVVTMPAGPVSLTATYVDAYYNLNIVNGTGDGTYTNGTLVEISANPAQAEMIFDQWTGSTQYVNNVNLVTALVTMPAKNISLTATYKAAGGQYTAHGTPYAWLTEYGFADPEADDLLDPDFDGLPVWQEYIAGTDPTNTGSCLKAAENPRNTVSWSAVSGRVYSVYWSTNLTSGFTNLSADILPPQSSYTNEAPAASANFYQIKVRMQ